MTNCDLWLKVNSDVKLLEEVSRSNLKDVASMAMLRKHWSVEEITIANELTEARLRAIGKLDNAGTVVSDVIGVQQATSSAIAQHKAKRFAEQDNAFDLCCGIGADLRALPNTTIGIDLDPIRSWMARENTGKTVICDDVTQYVMPNDCVIHIDPARRNAAGRVFNLDAMTPPFSEVSRIVSNTSGGCIKLSPAINPEDVKSTNHLIEIEYIEANNRLVQAAVWFGSLILNANSTIATSMTLNTSFSGKVEPPTFSSELKQWILEPNVSLERAGLHGTLGNTFGATELATGIGLLTMETNPCNEWFTAFKVIATAPLRIEKVSDILHELSCTQVEVKTRDKTINPNYWQKKLNKEARGSLLTIFALRLGKKRIAIITKRVT